MRIRFSDEFIFKWDNYLTSKGFKYNIKPKYTNQDYKLLEYFYIERFELPSQITKPNDKIIINQIEYIKTYSVSEDNYELFIECFNYIMDNHVVVDKVCVLDRTPADIKICDFTMDSTSHEFKGKMYKRINFKANSLLHSIMVFDICIDTAIKNYENKLKSRYKINDIVSTKSDRSKSYIIDNINVLSSISGSSSVIFDLLEIIESSESIIKYGSKISVVESDICPSRDNRIDNLLAD